MDGLSYSAADYFAAAWEDSGLGEHIYGTQTGGGGAEVKNLVQLQNLFPATPEFATFKTLASKMKNYGVDFKVSLRNMVRPNITPVEGLGVSPKDSFNRQRSDTELDYDYSLFESAKKELEKEKK